MTMNNISSEVSEKFIEGMRKRMEVSFHKYGSIKNAFPHKVNAIQTLEKILDHYKQTGNIAYLIDVANYAMIEFMLPAHEHPYFTPTDGSLGRKWFAGGAFTEKPNEGN